MYNVRDDDRKFSLIAKYEQTLQDLYNVARESMHVKLLLLHIMIRRLLMTSWFGPSEIVKCCYPTYEILVSNNTKWVTQSRTQTQMTLTLRFLLLEVVVVIAT